LDFDVNAIGNTLISKSIVSVAAALILLGGCNDTSDVSFAGTNETVQTPSQPQTYRIDLSHSVVTTGESVDFALTETKQVKSVEWRDENGKLLSTDTKFNKLFTQEGEYVILAVVTDTNDQVQTQKVRVKVTRNDRTQISENQPPVVKAKAESLDIMDEEYIHLSDDGSYDPDGTIVKYEWRDMDGILLSDTKQLDRMLHYWPQYDFNHDGTTTYVKTLYVTDDKGAVSSKSFTITVHQKETPNQSPYVDAGEDITVAL